ncbi:MAG: toll/interleukin-1 receptor domain-containing protein [Nitrospirales bacterium]|nr:toll/interleukin-1 receptor domain-containing protein [Nitrospira sp.]MDR4500755.1 toll/interleukin-1 receptor domain-containing protein [Nitrospirales bacterium]
MPSLFLSYAREDEAFAKALEEGLRQADIAVWRDRTHLHTGERWPKRLGEAIAENDCFLLLWSKPSSESNAVELEWTTAIALKKLVLLVLRDQTSLPASLAAIHAIDAPEPAWAVQEILTALKQPRLPADQKRNTAVIERLAGIASVNEAEVLEEAKAEFEQSRESTRFEPWHTWLGSIAAVFSIIGVVWGMWNPSPQPPPGPLGPEQIEPRRLARPLSGQIQDDQNHPLPAVQILFTSREDPALSIKDHTDKDGRYSVKIEGIERQEIQLRASKECYKQAYKTTWLGNTDFTFKLKGEGLCDQSS